MSSLPKALLSSLLVVLFMNTSAHAHTLSESISSWQINDNGVRLQFIVPDLEAKRLSSTGKDVPSAEAIGTYLSEHVGVSAAGRACDLVHGVRALSSTPGFSRFEFEFACSTGKDLKIRSSAFYEIVPTHTDFARIQDREGNFYEELLTNDKQEAAIADAGARGPLQEAGLPKFVAMGMMHIFTGVDHMSFMLGLVLISRRVRDLLFVVTGFTIGHSLTLALAVTGILRPDARYIDALVALTIALIGAENIGDSTHHPLPVALGLGGLLFIMAAAKGLGVDIGLPMTLLIGGGIFAAGYLLLTGQMRDAGKVRLLVTLVFGLIHGFGFASNLLEMRLPTDRLAELLVGFNLGVEVGQVAVVLGALLVAHAFVRMRLSMPRPLFTDLAASFLVGEGLYWFLGRSVILA
jgi:HupE / UreJ protein